MNTDFWNLPNWIRLVWQDRCFFPVNEKGPPILPSGPSTDFINQYLPQIPNNNRIIATGFIYERRKYSRIKIFTIYMPFWCFLYLYIIPPPHPHTHYTIRRKYKRSNVLYVVTQGHYVILPITSIFREY